MKLIKVLSKVVKENYNTKKILLEYPESTIKKLVSKFSGQTEDSVDVIKKTIADFERFQQAFANEDKDIFRHSYDKVKSLIADKEAKQKSKKDLEGLVQDYLNTWKDSVQVDLQLTKLNIKKFFEIRSYFPQLKEFKKDVTTFNPPQLNSLVEKYFSRFNNQGLNDLVAAIAENLSTKTPDENIITTILPRAKRFVRHFELIPVNTKLSKFMNFEEFESIVDGYTPIEESEYDIPEIDTSDINIPYEDDEILIFAPDQKQQCINIRKKHAPDRGWCTSYESSNNYYYKYRLHDNLTLYYIINKNLPSSDLNFASVILVDKYGKMRLADGSNKSPYDGMSIISWETIVSKIPPLEDKKQYFEPKPYTDEEQKRLLAFKNYDLKTSDPIAELGGEEQVAVWLEIKGPNLTYYDNSGEIFANFTEELQKKYIGLGNELSAQMVRALSPGGMTYYISRKKEKLLQKSLKDLNENDIELIMSKEMRPYFKSLKNKFIGELQSYNDNDYVRIEYPNDTTSKFVRMFGLNELFDALPENILFLQIENKSKDDIIFEIPESLGKFTSLESLVFENCIDKLPDSLGNLKRLKFLSMTNCKKLTRLPDSIVNLTCLDFISVNGDTPIDTETLPAEFKKYVDVEGDFWEIDFPDEMRKNCYAEEKDNK